MNFLAIDTTMDKIGIALSINGRDITLIVDECPKKHNNSLLPSIEKLLIENNCSLSEFDVLGVVTGPGSFTGIRVGVATINAMSFALDKKVIEITSLELARVGNEAEDILALIDCRNNNFYAGLFSDNETKYMAIDGFEASDYKQKHILYKETNPISLLLAMKSKIEKGEYTEKAKPFYLKKSSAERENGL